MYIAQVLSPISRFLIFVEIVACQANDDATASSYINYSDHDNLDNRQICFENEKILLIFLVTKVTQIND